MPWSAKTKRIKIVFFTTKSSDGRCKEQKKETWRAARPAEQGLACMGLAPPARSQGRKSAEAAHAPPGRAGKGSWRYGVPVSEGCGLGPGLARRCDHAQSPRAWAVCTRRSQARKSGADASHASQRITGLCQQSKVAYPDVQPLALRTDAALTARLRNERALGESVCACSSYAQCVACRRRDGRALRMAASSGKTWAAR